MELFLRRRRTPIGVLRLSFAGYVALRWLVAGRATSRMGIRESVEVTLGGAAATRLLPTACDCGGAAGASLITYVSGARATLPQGVTTVILGVAPFDDIDAAAQTDVNPGRASDIWKARITTKGATDVHMLQNTIALGGTFGWHSHPGPSLVIVKSGTATFYEADDRACAPRVVPTGSGFVDNGQDTHVVRNEGTVDLVTEVVSLVPAGFARRIDEPAPANCPSLPNG
jgi:quercetin dioxygenase-like cupin family protein